MTSWNDLVTEIEQQATAAERRQLAVARDTFALGTEVLQARRQRGCSAELMARHLGLSVSDLNDLESGNLALSSAERRSLRRALRAQ